MVGEHYAEGGIGYVDMSKIYNIIQVGKHKRTPQQTDEVANYLRNTLRSLQRFDFNLSRALVEELHVAAFKPGDEILP